MLRQLFQLQGDLQREAYGRHPADILSDEERSEFIKDMVLATTDELHEALKEVGWKPWATSRHLNREAFQHELVDALHFFINLCLASGLTADALFEGYLEKRQRNIERQQAGYDGLQGKCPRCKRAFDDIAQIEQLPLSLVTGMSSDGFTIICTICVVEEDELGGR